MISARNCWRGISGPVHATARGVSVASPLVTAANICVSASTSDRVLPDSYGDHPLTDLGAPRALPPETQSRPSRHALCCLTDGTIKPTINSRTVNSALVSRDVTAARRSRTEAGAERVASVRSRSADVARRRPAARGETPAGPVVPGDLDTLPARAAAAGAVRCAFLLVGIRAGPSTDVKEPITGSQQGEERWRPTPRASTASRTRSNRR